MVFLKDESIKEYLRKTTVGMLICIRYHSRFFVEVGHETTYTVIGNRQFFTKTRHQQTYQNCKGSLKSQYI